MTYQFITLFLRISILYLIKFNIQRKLKENHFVQNFSNKVDI